MTIAEEENIKAEQGIGELVNAMDKIETVPVTSTARSGEFQIKVSGNPYAGFAKGPKDLPSD